MKPFANAMVLIAAGVSVAALGACGSSSSSKTSSKTSSKSSGSGAAQASTGCPHTAASDPSYAGKFEGPQSTAQTMHVVQVTHNGQPVSGATVCVNTAMVGMSTMHYSVKANPAGPGRYQAPFRFEMEGTYRGNVVTKVGGKMVSIPVSVYVSKTNSMSISTTSTMTHSMHMTSSTMTHMTSMTSTK